MGGARGGEGLVSPPFEVPVMHVFSERVVMSLLLVAYKGVGDTVRLANPGEKNSLFSSSWVGPATLPRRFMAKTKAFVGLPFRLPLPLFLLSLPVLCPLPWSASLATS